MSAVSDPSLLVGTRGSGWRVCTCDVQHKVLQPGAGLGQCHSVTQVQVTGNRHQDCIWQGVHQQLRMVQLATKRRTARALATCTGTGDNSAQHRGPLAGPQNPRTVQKQQQPLEEEVRCCGIVVLVPVVHHIHSTALVHTRSPAVRYSQHGAHPIGWICKSLSCHTPFGHWLVRNAAAPCRELGVGSWESEMSQSCQSQSQSCSICPPPTDNPVQQPSQSKPGR